MTPLANHSWRIISVNQSPYFLRATSLGGAGLEHLRAAACACARSTACGARLRLGLGDVAHADRPPLDLVGARAGSAPPQPLSTASSFQPRSTASWMPVFMPNPPVGDIRCAASPAMKTRPRADSGRRPARAAPSASPTGSRSRSAAHRARQRRADVGLGMIDLVGVPTIDMRKRSRPLIATMVSQVPSGPMKMKR